MKLMLYCFRKFVPFSDDSMLWLFNGVVDSSLNWLFIRWILPKNMTQSLNYIGLFILMGGVTALLLFAFKLQFVFVMPTIIFTLSQLFRRKKA